MREPDWIDVATPSVQLRALTWGPPDGPIALCLHGFPDTPYGWRKIAPQLVDAGWRVVAPFMRGYAPSSIPADGSYHVGALIDDALQVLDAAGPTGRDVVIGHDWGAGSAAGLAAMPDSPFVKAVIMSMPPFAAFRPLGPGARSDPTGGTGSPPSCCAAGISCTSNCLGFLRFPHPGWCRRCGGSGRRVMTRHDDIRLVEDAIGAPENWRAAIGMYRQNFRGTKPPAEYADLHPLFLKPPAMPILYLHGDDDGCMAPDYISWVERVLPAGQRRLRRRGRRALLAARAAGCGGAPHRRLHRASLTRAA